jgi:hypothetical protein
MRQKEEFPYVGGGYKMATQAILAPPQAAYSSPKAAYLGKDANTHVTVCSKVAVGPYVASHVIMSGFGAKQPFLCLLLNEGFLQETYLTK